MRLETWGARKALVVAVMGCVSMIPAAGQEKAWSSVNAYATLAWPGRGQGESIFGQIVGNSTAFESVLEQVGQVAPTGSTVLIQGETGTGKELIAQAIYKSSLRSRHAFVKLNCAAIPLDLLESELFGHVKGAFTGAICKNRSLSDWEAAGPIARTLG